MTLYRKNGSVPQPLPAVDYDAAGLSWTDLENNPDGLQACGWAPAPPAPVYDPATHTLAWSEGLEDWTLSLIPPPPPPPPPPPSPPIRVTKADFQRRLQPAERYAINALRRQVAALSAADYANPANAMLLAAEDVLQAFDLPAEFIELDHPDTFAGLSLFAYLGVLTQERVVEILTP